MADLDRIKRNVAKMAGMQAPEADIDGYIASEGVTIDAVRAHRMGASSAGAARIYDDGFDPMGNATGGLVEAPAQVADPRWKDLGDLGADVGGVLDGGMRMIANGLTVGMADRFAGGMDAVTGQAEGYGDGVNAQRARTEAMRQEYPVMAGAAEAAGGLVGGLGMIRNGVTLAGRMGPGLFGRTAAFGAEGAAYGAAHGAGNTYSDNPRDYIENAGEGAKWGGAIGAGLPMAGAAAGALVRGGQALAGPNVEGVGRVGSALLRGAAQADEAGLRALPQMGPEAMLVDAGPSMLGLGQGAGTGTGVGRSELVNALRTRDAGTGPRLTRMLDETIGPAPTPSTIRAGLDDSKRRIGARYDEPLSSATMVDTTALAEGLDAAAFRLRGPAQAAVKRVRGYLDAVRSPSAPALAPGQKALDTSAETLFQTRQAIDGLLAGEADPKVIRQLTIARQGVDDILADAAPGIKQIDGQYAEIARQDDALTRGSTVFGTGKTAVRPSELSEELRAGVIPQGEMVGPSGASVRMRQGARAEVDRLVGTNVNDLNVLERTLATPNDWNSQKFAALFGEPERVTVADALANNRKFRQSYQDIVQGSQTAQRQTAQKAMDGETPIPLDTTVTGAALNRANVLWRALVGLGRNATKDEIAKVLAKQGPDALTIMRELQRGAAQANTGGATARGAVSNPALLGASGQYGGRR